MLWLDRSSGVRMPLRGCHRLRHSSLCGASFRMTQNTATRDPLVDNKYETFKPLLLSTFEPSKLEMACWVLALSTLGDQKPSEPSEFLFLLCMFWCARYEAAMKHQSQYPVAAIGTKEPSSLLFIKDSVSGWCFLCDTDSFVNILLVSQLDMQSGVQGFPWEAANGSTVE